MRASFWRRLTVLPRPCSAPAARLLTRGAIRLVLQAPPWQSAGSLASSSVALDSLVIPLAPGSSLSLFPLRGVPWAFLPGEVSLHLFQSGGSNFSAPTPAALHPGAPNFKGPEAGDSPVPMELLGKSDSVFTHSERKGSGALAYYPPFTLQVENLRAERRKVTCPKAQHPSSEAELGTRMPGSCLLIQLPPLYRLPLPAPAQESYANNSCLIKRHETKNLS